MMINNNPYNMPERLPQNKNRVYPDANILRQDSDAITPYTRYLAGQSYHPTTMSKNVVNVADDPTTYRHQYPGLRNEIKHFLPSPKNNTNNSTNLNNFIPSSPSNRANLNIGSSLQKKQPGSLRQSIGVTGFESLNSNANMNMKQINERIQAMALTVKSNQKRLTQLEKNAFLTSGSNNAKLNDNDSTPISGNIDINHALSRYQSDWIEKFHNIQLEIQTVREEVKNKNSIKNLPELDKMIVDKFKELSESSKVQLNLGPSFKNNPQELKKEVEGLRVHLEQKMKKNFEFLTSVIGRLQRQFHNGLIQVQPNFKPSPIKCSTSAILLRFVQCFKVRKHSAKSGQIKITVSDNTYYIDGEGYLLDKQQFYIVDSRDCRVRLEDKHIKLLKQQNILQ